MAVYTNAGVPLAIAELRKHPPGGKTGRKHPPGGKTGQKHPSGLEAGFPP